MSNPTTPFSWQMPTATDLVTDLPADFEVFGQAVATSMADLLGGTTGQILSKASAADMDFTWIANDQGDITGVTAGTGITVTSPTGPVPTVSIDTATTVDKTTSQTLTNKTLTSPVLTTPSISNINAKGDILVGTADNTLGIITAGNNGETLVADSSTSSGLRWQSNFAAGKNAIINGAFNVWQRGTSIAAPGSSGAFLADRFNTTFDVAPTSGTITQQTFTPGTAPVAGYEGTYFNRTTVTTVGTSAYYIMGQKIEDVRTFAGQTVTVSFWAKLNSGAISTPRIRLTQNFGSGGSAAVSYDSSYNYTPTGSWQRFSWTIALSSISGKTIGTSSYLQFDTVVPYTAANAVDTWGWQVEAGNTATAFQTATGTIQGELAACQRYYYRQSGTGNNTPFGLGFASSTTNARILLPFPTAMRVAPTSVDFSTLGTYDGGTQTTITAISLLDCSTTQAQVYATVASGLTANRPYFIQAKDTSAAYLALNAEL